VNPIGSDQITDESIVSADIDDGSVAPADLSSATASTDEALIFNGTDVVWGTPATAVNTDGTTITGNGLNTDLSVGAIGSSEITDGSIATVDLNTDAVTDTELADGAVDAGAIQTGAVTSDGVLDGTLTTADFGSGVVTSTVLADGVVTTAKLSPTPPTDGGGDQVLTWSDPSNELVWQAEGTLSSSIRWKENVQPLANPVDLVERMRGVRYDWTESGEADVGVIAEEVAEVLPELVEFDESGRARAVHYAKLAAVLIEATKAQQQAMDAKAQTIEDQRRTIERQQDEIDALKSRMDRLERLVDQVTASGSTASESDASSAGDARQ
jgi:polyhydroxyalkanoate synthesis regulator phasin